MPVGKALGQEVVVLHKFLILIWTGASIIGQEPCRAIIAKFAIRAAGKVRHNKVLINNIHTDQCGDKRPIGLVEFKTNGIIIVGDHVFNGRGVQIGEALSDGHQALCGENNIRRGKLGAIMELHALFEMERVGKAVIAGFPCFC